MPQHLLLLLTFLPTPALKVMACHHTFQASPELWESEVLLPQPPDGWGAAGRAPG